MLLLFKKRNGKSAIRRADDYLEHHTTTYGFLVLFLVVAIVVMSMAWIAFTGINPQADQDSCLQAAHHIVNGDYRDFLPGAYMHRYENQYGLVLLEALLLKLFPAMSADSFGYLNSVIVGGIALLSERIAHELRIKRVGRIAALGLFILFPYMQLYCSFVYGTLPGMLFTVLAFYLAILYTKTNQIKYAVFSAVGVCFAVILKQNYLIALLALLCYHFMHLIRAQKDHIRNRLRKTLPIVFLLVAFLISAKVPRMICEHYVGSLDDSGTSAWAFVSMGLNEYGGNFGPGWYDESTADYYESTGFSKQAQNEICKVLAKEKIISYIRSPKTLVRFYYKKLISEWCEPTYQSLWIRRVQSAGENTWLYRFLHDEALNLKIVRYANFGPVLFYFGYLLWTITKWKKRNEDTDEYLLMVFGIGGFLFHSIWEAKSQYILPYVVISIPMVVKGIGRFFEGVSEFFEKKKALNRECIRKYVIITIVVFLLLVTVTFTFRTLTTAVQYDTQEEFIRRYDYNTTDVQSGYYKISPANATSFYYTFSTDGVSLDTEGTAVYIDVTGGICMLYVADDLCLSRSGPTYDSGCHIVLRNISDPKSDEWHIWKLDKGTYRITQNGFNRAAISSDYCMSVSAYRYRQAGEFILTEIRE